MHFHILGISGTFMSALAILARESGHKVTGSDEHCYPPVSDLLKDKGIEWSEGFEDLSQMQRADLVIVGNAMKRGLPVVEAMLNAGKPYISGPQWLAENILKSYRVMAVAGTHGKTTTTTMLTFILQKAGLNPGFLIGGVAPNFSTSAKLGKGEWFVIEADEYDSAFFDKRPKLMHYRPEIAVINTLEFDHADIYPNLEAIQQQFHYYLKTIPSKGVVIALRDDPGFLVVRERGLFSKLELIATEGEATWRAEILDNSGEKFRVWHNNKAVAEVSWSLIGRFNVENGLGAIAASSHAGIDAETAAQALAEFKPVKRRLEVRYSKNGITLYDDFAHHPTAIRKTIEALVDSKRHKRILVVIEFASYTMRTGVHKDKLAESFVNVDSLFVLNPADFNISDLKFSWPCPHKVLPTTEALITALLEELRIGDGIVVMSNRGFDGLHLKLISRMEKVFDAQSIS